MRGVSFFEKNAMGRLSWLRTAPTPSPEASVSNTNGREKSGIFNTGADVTAFLRLVKASAAVELH